MNEELTRLPCCLRTGIPMSVVFSFPSGYKRFSSAMKNKPYPRFYGCPHCFRRKTKQYSVRLNVCFISQFICPLFSGISRHLIYYFTILYLQAIFLKHTFSSRLISLWQRTSMKRKFNDARIALSSDLLRDYYGPSIPLYQYPVYGTQGNPVILDLLVNGFLLDWLIDFYSSIAPDFSLTL